MSLKLYNRLDLGQDRINNLLDKAHILKLFYYHKYLIVKNLLINLLI